jgi:pyruvate kinase
MHIYLNDGKQKLFIDKIVGNEIYTTIKVGGTIKGRRGVNVPDADLSISSLTAKDKKDLKFGLEQGVDFMTLSFVRTADDIHQLRKLIGKEHNVAIVAKIETKHAIDNLDAIVEAADVLMVARGDLAIETPLEKVPLLQKRIIKTANYAGKPVITATQMLDSMRIATTPTRAEVADIANAILDGTDALMLSDETAVGIHPDRGIGPAHLCE